MSMNKKNVLFVINTLTTGGANSSLSALYARMKEDYDIKVFALCHDGNAEAHGFLSALLPKDRTVDAFFGDFAKASRSNIIYKLIVKILRRMCNTLRIDLERIVYSHAVKSLERKYHFDVVVAFQEEASALFASMFSCRKKVAWIHCDFTRGYPHNDADIYKHYGQIVFVSRYTEEQFLKKFPHYRGKTTYVYNFLDEQRIIKLSKEPVTDIAMSSEDGYFNVLSLGRIVPLKRFSKIPQLVSDIKAGGCKVRWIILGPRFDDEEFVRLTDNIRKYGVEDEVIWLGGKDNPYPYMAKSQLCVALSTTEACPMIFNEARVLSVPIVSTDFGSAYEFINSGTDGYVCPIERIASVVSKLCSDAECYSHIRKNANTRYINNEEICMKLHTILC